MRVRPARWPMSRPPMTSSATASNCRKTCRNQQRVSRPKTKRGAVCHRQSRRCWRKTESRHESNCNDNQERKVNVKTKWILISMAALALGIVTLGVTGCKKSEQEQGSGEQPGHEHSTTTKYTCSMHPDVVQDKTGNCPK